MLGEFITRLLVLILGYAYPAFECFKTVEKNRVEIQELRFWCQYWILVAFLTVFERIADIFISWLPMYGELKLALLIYLWYPKTKGTSYVYNNLLRPYMTRHGTETDRKIQELGARAWDFALYYWENCTELGQTKIFEMLQYLTGQSSRLKHGNQKSDQQIPGKSKNWISRIISRSVVESPKSKLVQFEPDCQSEYFHSDGCSIPEFPSNSKLQQDLLKLRRTKPHN